MGLERQFKELYKPNPPQVLATLTGFILYSNITNMCTHHLHFVFKMYSV
jgi:hypothetical protein